MFLLEPIEQVVDAYLAPNEEVILQDNPALGEFFLLSFTDLLIVVGALGASIVLAVAHRPLLALAAFLFADALVFRLVLRRFRDYYTRYVITDLRIMRVSGVFSRVSYSIPLGKITDVAYSQRWWERWGPFGGYATIEIDSASEKSGLDKLRGLHDPARFNRVLLSMVADKQGFVVPGTAALNKRRAREDHLKLNIRFHRELSELFSEPNDSEMKFARAGVQRELDEREERMLRLAVMRRMAAHPGALGGDGFDLGDEPVPGSDIEDDGGD
jgi:Bacterial PH domain